MPVLASTAAAEVRKLVMQLFRLVFSSISIIQPHLFIVLEGCPALEGYQWFWNTGRQVSDSKTGCILSEQAFV